MPVPAQPKIYHIVHVDNLASIVADGRLWSDSNMIKRGGPPANIGMQSIKTARLSMPVVCHPGTFVGQYVPFNFCPRSVMLNIIWYGNHPNLTYRGGQQPIVHLQVDLHEAICWADQRERRWAFSLANARAAYTQFRARVDQLGELNWDAIAATDFRKADVKEAKQAEFLVKKSFPWHLVERVVVHPRGDVQKVSMAMKDAAHRPRIEIKKEWYY